VLEGCAARPPPTLRRRDRDRARARRRADRSASGANGSHPPRVARIDAEPGRLQGRARFIANCRRVFACRVPPSSAHAPASCSGPGRPSERRPSAHFARMFSPSRVAKPERPGGQRSFCRKAYGLGSRPNGRGRLSRRHLYPPFGWPTSGVRRGWAWEVPVEPLGMPPLSLSTAKSNDADPRRERPVSRRWSRRRRMKRGAGPLNTVPAYGEIRRRERPADSDAAGVANAVSGRAPTPCGGVPQGPGRHVDAW